MFLLFVASLSWNNATTVSGSRDRSILQWDYRAGSRPIRKLVGHSQEVCGLRWSPDHQLLASGGNDNKVSSSSSRVAPYYSIIYTIIIWKSLESENCCGFVVLLTRATKIIHIRAHVLFQNLYCHELDFSCASKTKIISDMQKFVKNILKLMELNYVSLEEKIFN